MEEKLFLARILYRKNTNRCSMKNVKLYSNWGSSFRYASLHYSTKRLHLHNGKSQFSLELPLSLNFRSWQYLGDKEKFLAQPPRPSSRHSSQAATPSRQQRINQYHMQQPENNFAWFSEVLAEVTNDIFYKAGIPWQSFLYTNFSCRSLL